MPLRKLGEGGFATIYEVWDLQSQQPRVLKLLLDDSPKAQELFLQEAHVLAELDCPGIPTVETGQCDRITLGQRSLLYLVMEKVEGETLEELLDRHPDGFPQARLVQWLFQALDILETLHQRQIIHRDLKPSNLMLTTDESGQEQLVTIDFGGAKQISNLPPHARPRTSTRLMSPGYSPPEQIAGTAIAPNADFYALGRTCVHLLTGKHPSELEDPITGELKWRHWLDDPIPSSLRSQPALNPVLADVLDAMMAADARQRPATAAEIRHRLQGVNFPTLISAPPVGNALTAGLRTFLTTLGFAGRGAKKVAFSLYRLGLWFLNAWVDTFWAALMGCLGGGLGALVGYLLYASFLGDGVVDFLNSHLQAVAPGLPDIPEAWIIFCPAGLGTALGLVVSDGFGQKTQAGIAALMGSVGYLVGGTLWLMFSGEGGILQFLALPGLSSALLILGLRIERVSLQAIAASIAMVMLFLFLGSLTPLDGIPANSAIANALDILRDPNWDEFLHSVILFGLTGASLGLCLGVSHYLILPYCRFLELI